MFIVTGLKKWKVTTLLLMVTSVVTPVNCNTRLAGPIEVPLGMAVNETGQKVDHGVPKLV